MFELTADEANWTEIYNTLDAPFFIVPWVRQPTRTVCTNSPLEKSWWIGTRLTVSPIRLLRTPGLFLRIGGFDARCLDLRQSTDGNGVGVNRLRQCRPRAVVRRTEAALFRVMRGSHVGAWSRYAPKAVASCTRLRFGCIE